MAKVVYPGTNKRTKILKFSVIDFRLLDSRNLHSEHPCGRIIANSNKMR